ncbi:hypothetical protein [Pareuzebyella sediminis]|uniref:hypothetical protein n=1 Tax=Pareuzebyella sediminis TaxID=2607998 RepID=UPI0011EF29BA|nr:hypothetical protein [Pareuzebyella sediminis]
MKKLIVILFMTYGAIAFSQKDACVCCSDAYHSFDFWVGTWTVTDSNGNLVGKNTIEKVEGGCALRERWISSNGKSTGTSLNFYNGENEQWEQLWIDNSGGHLKLSGNRKGNQMILSSEEKSTPEDQIVKNRITWTLNDNGTVRQQWEVLEEGQVITVLFDGLYHKIE